MRDTTVLRRLLALPEIGVTGVELTADGLIVDVRLRWDAPALSTLRVHHARAV